ncbi:hypothetical protein ILYODFUR_023200 [Ilyodon furcidens]|uniref:Uncharacterized protein n=1 Tax=Ilyodon furcidens TaxID=33524 RepID=A0ABV0VGD0_9TELE
MMLSSCGCEQGRPGLSHSKSCSAHSLTWPPDRTWREDEVKQPERCQGDDCLLVHSGDVEGVPRLPLQDGVFQLGVLTEVCVGCGDASNLCAWDGKFGNREGPHAWEQRHDGTH